MKHVRRRLVDLRRRLPHIRGKVIENLLVAGSFTAGLALVAYGVWTIDHAAGLIVGGALLVTSAVLYELSTGSYA